MLLKSRISNISMYENNMFSEHWRKARTGKFTSSNIWKLMGEKGFGETGMSYIRTRVFEDLSGVSSESDIINDAIIHGMVYEISALRKFCEKRNIDRHFMRTQVLINAENERFGGTPDGIWIKKESENMLSWDISTIEIKCFQPEHHMEVAECNTPQDLKDVDRKVYFQILDHALIGDCLEGYGVFYNPDLPQEWRGYHEIHFRKMQAERVNGKNLYPILEDLVKLKNRKAEALKIFESIKIKLLNTNGN